MSAEIKNLNTKKEPRSPDAVRQEYQNLAFKAGNLQYEIVCKERDLQILNDTMRELNFEFIEAQNKAEADKKAAEAAKEPVADAK